MSGDEQSVVRDFSQEIEDLLLERWDFHFDGHDWRFLYEEEHAEEERDDPPLVLLREDGRQFEVSFTVTARERP